VMRPALGTLEWSHRQSSFQTIAPFFSGTSLASRNLRRFYRVREVRPADASPAGGSTTAPTGRLSQPAGPGSPARYVTSAGWLVIMDLSTITVISPDEKATYQHWGHPHENLNGKHVKDWLTTRRTMLLPGNAMITLKASGPHGVVDAVSIYDVDQTHKLNMTNNTVAMSALLVRVGEATEPDGETMRIWHIGNGRYYAENVYSEETTGEGSAAQQDEVPLGATGGDANPNQVNDYYDDLRLGHT